MSNIMKEVASALGVRLGERFEIKNLGEGWYLTEYGLMHKACGKNVYNSTLADLITGERELAKQPWRPQVGEPYYYWSGKMGACLELMPDTWGNHTADIAKLAMGNCFRTGEEAIANKDKVLAAYKAILDSLQDNK